MRRSNTIRRAVLGLWLGLLLTCAGGAWSVPGPENVLVVVNAASEPSRRVAEEYVQLRRIPASNVLYLRDVPQGDTVSAAEFRLRILVPILEALRRRGLEKQVDVIAYSTGFPYAVDVREDMKGRTFSRYLTQPASLTGLTYLYEQTLRADASYLDLQANRAYRSTQRRRQAPWSEADQRLGAVLQEKGATLAARVHASPRSPETKRLLAECLAMAEELSRRHSDSPELMYDLACLRALSGDADGAMRALNRAVEVGWLNAAHTEADPDLASLRNRADFRALIARMKAVRVKPAPPMPFHAQTRWGADGLPTNRADGKRYLLCAMLGYIGPNANTLEEVRNCLRRSVGADHSRPSGTIYFMISGDTARTGPRRALFQPAKEALEKLRVRAEVLEGVLPMNRRDVAGAVVGAASFDWKSSGSRILPGAFCDHLTSFAGAMRGAGQTLLSEWIRHGAAGSSGTVTEPYAIAAKFPSPFLHVFYAHGCSLAEAFYQSVSGPYQQLLVGDPLCAPWARRVQVSVPALRDGMVLQKPIRLKPRCMGAKPVLRYELYADGVLRKTVRPERVLALDPAQIGPGTHEVRVVAVAGSLEWRGRTVFRVAVRGRPAPRR